MEPPIPATSFSMASARADPPFAMTPFIPSGEYVALIMYLDMRPLLSVAPDPFEAPEGGPVIPRFDI